MSTPRATASAAVLVAVCVVLGVLVFPPAASAGPVPPPAGPVAAGTNGLNANNRGLYCNSVLYGPMGASSPTLDDGIGIVFRCYGNPTTANVSSATVTTFTSALSDSPTATPRTTFTNCAESGTPNPDLGRFQMTCVVPDGGVFGGNESAHIRRGPSGGGFANSYYFRVSIVLDNGVTYGTNSANAGTDTELWSSQGVWQQYLTMSPPWPGWWPSAATGVPLNSRSPVALPQLECSARLRLDSDGVVRATAKVFVKNSKAALTQEQIDQGYDNAFTDSNPEWGFSWDGGGGEPSSSVWWDRPTNTGNPLEDLGVPMTNVPSGGWTIAVRVQRVIDNTGDYRGEYGDRFPEFPDGVPDPSGQGGTFLPDGYEWKWVPFPLPTGSWVPAPSGTNGHYVPEDGSGSLPTAWTSAYSVCTMRVDPRKVGGPQGDGGGGTGDPLDEDGGPRDNPPGDGGGEDGGDDGCGAPEGWNLINPIAWASQIGCVLGPLWDLLGELIDLIGDAISGIAAIVSWLTNLGTWIAEQLVPTEGFDVRSDRLSEELGDSAVGTITEMVNGFYQDVQSAMSSSGDGAAGGPSCQGPSFNLTIGGQTINARPFNSCGNLAIYRQLVNGSIAVAISYLGLRKIAALVLRPFGVSNPVGGGDE